MQSTLSEKTTSGKLWAPNSAGPVCIAHPAHPISTPLQFGQVTWLLCSDSVESDDFQFEVDTVFDWEPVQPCKNGAKSIVGSS